MRYQDIIKELKIQSKKIRGRYPPISEIVDNDIKLLKIKNIYKIDSVKSRLYLFQFKNYHSSPKQRFFLAYVLASQSSDLIVLLTKKLALETNLRLVQFSIHPKTQRVNLLLLKELKEIDSYFEIINTFETIHKKFKTKIEGIQKILEKS
ncbi:MAG: hypothetical protein JXA99_14940 [Candidatus Lokiarchaeota archaeon]|nr:hypothetical protein [Candidatus Lokiarchaeota archaeon]